MRTGFDVLKIRALGGDVALIGRPLAQVCIGGGYVAVKMYFDYVKDDLRRAMLLTGCDTLKDANMSILDKLGQRSSNIQRTFCIFERIYS